MKNTKITFITCLVCLALPAFLGAQVPATQDPDALIARLEAAERQLDNAIKQLAAENNLAGLVQKGWETEEEFAARKKQLQKADNPETLKAREAVVQAQNELESAVFLIPADRIKTTAQAFIRQDKCWPVSIQSLDTALPVKTSLNYSIKGSADMDTAFTAFETPRAKGKLWSTIEYRIRVTKRGKYQAWPQAYNLGADTDLLCRLLSDTLAVWDFTASSRSKPKEGKMSKVTLKVMAYGDIYMNEGETWKKIVADFQAANPDIKIQDEMRYDEAYHQKAKARLAAGDYPHVAYQGADERWAAEWRDAGQQFDHRALIDGSYYDLGLIPAMGDNGEIWEIPLGTSNICTVLYVNTELLAKYGMTEVKTYDDMVKLVEPAKQDGVEVVAMAGRDGWVWNSCLLSAIIGRVSGDAEWMRKAVKGEFKFTDPVFVDSLALIEKMLKDGVLPASTLYSDYGGAMSRFANNQAIFFVQGQWAAGSLFDARTDPDAFTKQAQIKMIPFPSLPGEKPGMAGSVAAVVQTGYGLTRAGAADPATLRAGLAFIKFLSNMNYTTQRLRDGAIVAPVLKSFPVPDDLEPIIKEKIRFALSTKMVTNVVDAFLKQVPNDALNSGIQDMALGCITGESGHATPASIAAQVEELARNPF